MTSDISTQSLGKKASGEIFTRPLFGIRKYCRSTPNGGSLKWKKIDAQSRRDPSAPVVLDGGRSVVSARAADECSRVLGLEFTEAAERVRADLVRKAMEGESDTWRQFKVFSSEEMGTQTQDVVGIRLARTW